MSSISPFPISLELPIKLGELLLDAAEAMAKQSGKAFRFGRRARRGATLHPGRETPLWNELREQLRPHMLK